MSHSLQGKSVLITREKQQAEAFAKQIENFGGKPLVVPLLSIEYKSDISNPIWLHLKKYEWILFTSSNGVHGFFHFLHQLDIEFPSDIKVGIVGTKTKLALDEYELKPDFIPSIFDAETMAKEFIESYDREQPILIVRGNLSRNIIPNDFTEHNISYDTIEVYETTYRYEAKRELEDTIKNVDFVTLTSPSTVTALMKLVKDIPFSCDYICIGTTTEAKAEKLQIPNLHIPSEFTTDAMIEVMIDLALGKDVT
ncbi:uroporphyrinogen-III synthase [Oceanobacillus iheyensis]|uniref:Uroporphyrinogen-III synthase n=1 Tax=Oceanobacillus iheyensis (strain DSM 14371 / CIP 107618 / JCM 11309 / KCTC 3954 / HTE831) TaxID=221109 RepID=Q8EPM9_OCEIH|nr:uroporphyrinogen-III synthase [Oceanobacillus iheyensis]BAC14023.1 uroporphyrinogen-III synthase [Oceanobacillus iheyensis HTE831]